MMMSESQLQVAVANYLATRYPKVQFHSDFGSGVKLTMGQARANKAQNAGRRGWPDLFVAEARGGFNGLFLELKADGVRIKKKNGEWANPHIQEQAHVLASLSDAGYYARFAVGFDEAVIAIDAYLGCLPTEIAS